MGIFSMRVVGSVFLLAFMFLTPSQSGALDRIQVAQSSTIREIQELLTKHGFMPGSASGFVNETTKTAISEFQRRASMTVDGKPSLNLLDHLRDPKQEWVTARVNATSTATETQAESGQISEGSVDGDWLMTLVTSDDSTPETETHQLDIKISGGEITSAKLRGHGSVKVSGKLDSKNRLAIRGYVFAVGEVAKFKLPLKQNGGEFMGKHRTRTTYTDMNLVFSMTRK